MRGVGNSRLVYSNCTLHLLLIKVSEHSMLLMYLINPFATELFFGFRRNLNMLFSTMCWLFCYCLPYYFYTTTVHHISNESEDM